MAEFTYHLEGGAGVQLHTGGKYCPGDIAVTSEKLDDPLAEQAELIAAIGEALAQATTPSPGTGGAATPTQEKTVAVTENGTVVVEPDAGYALSRVTVEVDVQEPDPLADYQRVEYITAAAEGTYPYIITDFYADNESGMEVIAAFPELVDRIPMGSRENSDPTRFYCVYPLSANSVYYGFNTGVTISCKLTVDTVYRLQTNFLNSRLVNVYEADGNRKGGGAISDTLDPAHTVPVAIFGYNYAASGAVSSKREYLLYGARCSQGHDVVREYIPVRRKSDGAVGVLEKIGMTFLGNAGPDGSAFVAGPDIDW